MKKKDLLLLLGSLVFSFILVEGCLRLLYRLNYDSFMPYGIREEALERTQLLRLKANFSGKNNRSGILYETNAQGYRDDAIDPTASHVIFLGDSATFGLNLTHEQTFPFLTGELLKKSCGKVQTINTASPGQGTLDERDNLTEALSLRELIHPKAVVLAFIQNDISDNSAYDLTHREDAFLEQHVVRATIRHALRQFKRFRTVLYLREFVHYLRDHSTPAAKGFEGMPHEPGREVEYDMLSEDELAKNKSFTLTLDAIDQVAKICEEAHLPFVFVYMPSGDREILSGKAARYKALIEKHLASRHIRYVDVLSVYEKQLASIGKPTSLPDGYYLL